MTDGVSRPPTPLLTVAAGEDRYGEYRGLGVSAIQFKVTTQDTPGLYTPRLPFESIVQSDVEIRAALAI